MKNNPKSAHNSPSIKTFAGPLILFWIVALIVLICFNLLVHQHLRHQIDEAQVIFKKSSVSADQRIILQHVAYLSRLLLMAPNEDVRQDIRNELSSNLDRLESNQKSLIVSSNIHQVSNDILSLNFQLPHQINTQIQEFIKSTKALAVTPNEALIVSDPNYVRINESTDTLGNSLGQLIKQYQNESKMKLEGIDIYRNWILLGNLFILMLITMFIIFPLLRKIQQQFAKISQKSIELETSSKTALDMMEDAQSAKKFAEERRDIAQRLAAIVESSEDAILGKKLDGTLTSWNKGAEKIYGYTSAEMVGKSIKTIIPQDKEGELEEILTKIGKGERFEHFETTRRHKDGRILDVSLTVSPIRDVNGTSIVGASAIARDITEIKKARQVIQEREKWFRALIENSQDLLMQVDTDAKIIYVSPSVKKILGYDAEEIVGQILFDYIHPDDLNLVTGLFKDVLTKADQLVAGEARFKHSDGSWRWLEGSGKNLVQNPDIKAVVVNARDFTDRKRFEEKLKEFAREMKKNNEELESFAFIASHDLQEPLRIVSSYAQLFTQRYQENLDETSQRYVKYIVDNIKRMQDMINGLLIYSRIGKKEQILQLVDCVKVCDMAIANLKFSVEQKNVKIERGNMPILLGNEVELLQLFQNLIGNAIKYCDKDNPIIHISSERSEDYWIFCVKDNGIGIEPEYFKQIFEIFKRLHTQKEYPGTGIGLAICKKIVDNNGGEIWVESKLGLGSEFYFKLPIRKGAIYANKGH